MLAWAYYCGQESLSHAAIFVSVVWLIVVRQVVTSALSCALGTSIVWSLIWGWRPRTLTKQFVDLSAQQTTDLRVCFVFSQTCQSFKKSQFPRRNYPLDIDMNAIYKSETGNYSMNAAELKGAILTWKATGWNSCSWKLYYCNEDISRFDSRI